MEDIITVAYIDKKESAASTVKECQYITWTTGPISDMFLLLWRLSVWKIMEENGMDVCVKCDCTVGGGGCWGNTVRI